MITTLQLAIAMNLGAVLFVVALSLQARRYYNPSYLTHWIRGHLYEAAMIACDLPHTWAGHDFTTPQALAAGLFGTLSLWHYLQLGRVLIERPLPGWAIGPTLGLGVGSIGALRLAGAGSYEALTPLLLAILGCFVWLGWLFLFRAQLRTGTSVVWLGVPLWLRAVSAPLITVVGHTPWNWTNYVVGVGLHLMVGAGMVMFVMRKGSEALRERQALLEQTHKLQREFLHTMSHEVRTPIAVMAQAARAMVALTEEAQRAEMNDMVQDRAQALTRLVSSILDYAKLESGAYRPEPVEDDLGLYLTGWEPSWQVLAEGSRHTLTLSLAEEALRTRFDPALLRQAVDNLVANALKHTPEGAGVTVRAWRAGDEVRLSVTDTGPGVPTEVQAVIFEPFRQADGSSSRKHGGIGLGLPLCREIVQRYHHGRLWLEGLPGQGAAFHIALPASVSTG